MRRSVLLAFLVLACGPTTTGVQGTGQTVQCVAGSRAVREAISRMSEELRQTDLELASVGQSCSRLPSDSVAASNLVAANAKLPRIRNGLADAAIEGKDLEVQFPAEWSKLKADLGSRLIRDGDLAVDVRWCIRRSQICFDTRAVVDSLGGVKFEPVLSLGVWRARVEVQPRQVRRTIQFFDGFGAVIAEYKVDLTYRADACAITAGSEAIDILLVSINSAMFQEGRDREGPVIYKGANDCGQAGVREDWLRARATIELKTLTNLAVPVLNVGTVGVTKAVTIRFDVSASGVDRTQVAN